MLSGELILLGPRLFDPVRQLVPNGTTSSAVAIALRQLAQPADRCSGLRIVANFGPVALAHGAHRIWLSSAESPARIAALRLAFHRDPLADYAVGLSQSGIVRFSPEGLVSRDSRSIVLVKE